MCDIEPGRAASGLPKSLHLVLCRPAGLVGVGRLACRAGLPMYRPGGLVEIMYVVVSNSISTSLSPAGRYAGKPELVYDSVARQGGIGVT